MTKICYEEMYNWRKLIELCNDFLPELIEKQENIREEITLKDITKEEKEKLKSIGFSKEPREAKEVARELIDSVYPYRMILNHPRYFCFIPNNVNPYSVFGEFLNSIHNPYGGGYTISNGTATIENETLKWMGEQLGYDREKLGGQFVSGGSMANLTASVVARDIKLKSKDYTRATVYVSDQTHSSVAKGIHIMGLPRENVRKINTNKNFEIEIEDLIFKINEDIKQGYKPFLLVGSCGTTNTGSIDDLEKLGEIARKHDLWYHIDGAYGSSAILSSYKEKLKGIELSDSVSWDGHKWLFQTYGCAVVLCKDKLKMAKVFSVDPEYLKDVESTEEEINAWDMGLELTKPARGMKLWFTLQTVGIDAIKSAIDRGFEIADWIEEIVSKNNHFEIVSHSQMGIINFRYKNENFTKEILDDINRKISKMEVSKGHSLFLTTKLNDKVVLRFCCNNAFTTRDEIIEIIDNINLDIERIVKEYE